MKNAQLINKANVKVDEAQIDLLLSESQLPPGEILLLLSDAALANDDQGCCVPRQLVHMQDDYRYLSDKSFGRWDCCIAISREQCDAASSYPAYFTYLLGHELGHAKLCLSDICLHIHSCLIREFIGAVSDKVEFMEHLMPHERRCDQFGVYLSSIVHSRDMLSAEIERKVKEETKNQARLRSLLTVVPRIDFIGLRDELLSLSIPFKAQLIELWEEDRRQYGQNSLVSCIHDYEALFIA